MPQLSANLTRLQSSEDALASASSVWQLYSCSSSWWLSERKTQPVSKCLICVSIYSTQCIPQPFGKFENQTSLLPPPSLFCCGKGLVGLIRQSHRQSPPNLCISFLPCSLAKTFSCPRQGTKLGKYQAQAPQERYAHKQLPCICLLAWRPLSPAILCFLMPIKIMYMKYIHTYDFV